MPEVAYAAFLAVATKNIESTLDQPISERGYAVILGAFRTYGDGPTEILEMIGGRQGPRASWRALIEYAERQMPSWNDNDKQTVQVGLGYALQLEEFDVPAFLVRQPTSVSAAPTAP